MNRFYVQGELTDGGIGEIDAWAEDEEGNRLPPPDLTPTRVIKPTRKGLERLLDDIEAMEELDDPLMP